MASSGGKAQPKGQVTAKVIRGGEAEPQPQGKPASTWVTARYENGELRVTVAASAVYGTAKRTATATFDVPEGDETLDVLRDALDVILEAHGETARTRAQIAAARSLAYAADRGEE